MEKELVSYGPGVSGETNAISFVKLVKTNLVEASKSFFEIGFRLDEAQRLGYYKELGFESLADCAEFHFNFKKTLTYDLIKIYQAFADREDRMRIDGKFKDFNQSQLIVMASNYDGFSYYHKKFLNLIKPSDSVRKIKYASICHKAIYNSSYCSHIPFPEEDFKTADELISYVQEYTLKNYGWVKANYPKVITPELEEKYKSTFVDSSSELEELDEADEEIIEVDFNDISESDNETITEEPIQVTYESKGIELKADAPMEEKTEITEEILPEAKKRDEISKGLYNELLKLFSSTPGISFIMRDSLAKKIRKLLYEYLKSQKKELVNLLNADFSKYDYKITLHDRTQALNVFIGVLLNNVFECLEPPKEK